MPRKSLGRSVCSFLLRQRHMSPGIRLVFFKLSIHCWITYQIHSLLTQYYCEHCWAMVHSRPGREFHKPLVKEGADRPRTVHFRWWSAAKKKSIVWKSTSLPSLSLYLRILLFLPIFLLLLYHPRTEHNTAQVGSVSLLNQMRSSFSFETYSVLKYCCRAIHHLHTNQLGHRKKKKKFLSNLMGKGFGKIQVCKEIG